ncbi:hypothetical protein R3I94_008997 [Phoxinus phoxinus]
MTAVSKDDDAILSSCDRDGLRKLVKFMRCRDVTLTLQKDVKVSHDDLISWMKKAFPPSVAPRPQPVLRQAWH